MTLDQSKYQAYCQILEEELLLATGCTEPIAIAYAASMISDTLGCEPDRIQALLSSNIIKNVKSVIVPGTNGGKGIPTAIAAGIIANCPEKKLEVLEGMTEEQKMQIPLFLKRCDLHVGESDSSYVFDIDIIAYAQTDWVRVRIVDFHTNVVLVEKNGKVIFQQNRGNDEIFGMTDRSVLNVEDIVTFADTVDLKDVAFLIDRQRKANMAIAKEGICGDWGANIGRTLMEHFPQGIATRACAMAAAGSDARMNGCELPVGIVSGSGNQGMTASIPVIVYGEAIGANDELLTRALVVSNLITIHQKTGIGRLSAYCGAVSAGSGCGAGIAYLKGGRYREISHTVVNSVAILSGMICDGAKSSCAAKIAMAVIAGIMGYEMFQCGHQFYAGDGIVTKGVENTIANVGRLAKDGMRQTDQEIIRLMTKDL